MLIRVEWFVVEGEVKVRGYSQSLSCYPSQAIKACCLAFGSCSILSEIGLTSCVESVHSHSTTSGYLNLFIFPVNFL